MRKKQIKRFLGAFQSEILQHASKVGSQSISRDNMSHNVQYGVLNAAARIALAAFMAMDSVEDE